MSAVSKITRTEELYGALVWGVVHRTGEVRKFLAEGTQEIARMELDLQRGAPDVEGIKRRIEEIDQDTGRIVKQVLWELVSVKDLIGKLSFEGITKRCKFYSINSRSVEQSEEALKKVCEHLVALHSNIYHLSYLFWEKKISAEKKIAQSDAWSSWEGWVENAERESSTQRPRLRSDTSSFVQEALEKTQCSIQIEQGTSLHDLIEVLLYKKPPLKSPRRWSSSSDHFWSRRLEFGEGSSESLADLSGDNTPRSGSKTEEVLPNEPAQSDARVEESLDEIGAFLIKMDSFSAPPSFLPYFEYYKQGVRERAEVKNVNGAISEMKTSLHKIRTRLGDSYKAAADSKASPFKKDQFEGWKEALDKIIPGALDVYIRCRSRIKALEECRAKLSKNYQDILEYRLDSESIETLKGLHFPTVSFEIYELFLKHFEFLILDLDRKHNELTEVQKASAEELNACIYDRDYYNQELPILPWAVYYPVMFLNYIGISAFPYLEGELHRYEQRCRRPPAA